MKRRTGSEETRTHSAQEILRADLDEGASSKVKFQAGNKPVIRWVKGDGLDDPVTKVAIAQATHLFGSAVDYCLCTNGISAERVREILSWASEPVEWWQAEPDDNVQLKELLANADCFPDRYGYWWKWFPERVRPAAPEWILDGDMVITARPPWFKKWISGDDSLRVSQDDREPQTRWWRKPAARKRDRDYKYGEYSDLVDTKLKLYSGLISLPPAEKYMPAVAELLSRRPLQPNHDGMTNMSEQGVISVAFQSSHPKPIPLHQFPFAHAGTDFIEYGKLNRGKRVWGYHFTRSFVTTNPHFVELCRNGTLFSPKLVVDVDPFRWLSGGSGQWGIPGWGMKEETVAQILDSAASFAGKRVLDIGTSRGRIAASLANIGCEVTTVDIADRGAKENLAGLNVKVVVADVFQFLEECQETFDLIVVDMHGNTSADWQRLGDQLLSKVHKNGSLIINNALLNKVDGWSDETGVQEFLAKISGNWKVKIFEKPLPGLAVVKKKRLSL